uniref:MULE transposase domain-containing protein n=1 Tax=Acrobeloides nanus TaxID=290746 RepID=A0A914EK03_9BILA
MPRKTTENYETIFQELNVLEPTKIICDFELAEINAIKASLGGARIQGCYKHFLDCIWREFSRLHWDTIADEQLQARLNLFLALPFVKANDVYDTFIELRDWCMVLGMPRNANDFFEYMGRNWVGWVDQIGGFHRPIYEWDLWSVYNSVLEDLEISNNRIEGWHKALNASLNVEHPPVYRFLHELLEEQELTEKIIADLDAGEKSYETPITILRKRQLKNVVSEYDDYGSIEYLAAISANFRF